MTEFDLTSKVSRNRPRVLLRWFFCFSNNGQTSYHLHSARGTRNVYPSGSDIYIPYFMRVRVAHYHSVSDFITIVITILLLLSLLFLLYVCALCTREHWGCLIAGLLPLNRNICTKSWGPRLSFCVYRTEIVGI